jgi:hypothetical protein
MRPDSAREPAMVADGLGPSLRLLVRLAAAGNRERPPRGGGAPERRAEPEDVGRGSDDAAARLLGREVPRGADAAPHATRPAR